MPHNSSRFDFAKPSTHAVRAIVIRGKGRFAIVRPDVAPSVVISKNAVPHWNADTRLRFGGVPKDADAAERFEAGIQFAKHE